MPRAKLGFALAGLLMLSGAAAQFLPRTDTRALADQFVQALNGQSDVRAEGFVTPDAEVYLQGANTPVSVTKFGAFLDQTKRDKRRLHAVGRTYLTSTGAGWLVSFDSIDEAQAVSQTPELWMEVRIQDDHITRVWFHFTVEALARMNITPASYRDAALARGIPLPVGWAEGTPAMLSAADAIDQQIGFGRLEVARKFSLLPLVSGLILGVVSVLGNWKRRTSESSVRTCERGSMLVRLRNMRSAQPERGPR